MNPKKSQKVFVSATRTDLVNERVSVLEAIRQLQFQHVTMEYFGADPRDSIEVCLERVRESDVYVGIIAHRYGSVVETTGKSFTHMEYEEARRIDLPCYIYIRSDESLILPSFMEHNPESMKKLNQFKAELKKQHTVNYFNDANDLAIKVVVDLSKRIKVLDYEVLEKMLVIVSERYRLIQKDTDSKIHYLQKRLESIGVIETAGLMCPVCGRLLEKEEAGLSFGMKHPVCADCLVDRTDDVIEQLTTQHPEFLSWVEGCKKMAEDYITNRDKP
ncbi:MAG: DUF4062 domain-containing protein [Candidatus Bathyarchaeota archaeon]|nr:DUF4062 domain-containing protein [Candidatus Bathyarchaeota archaeon]